MSVTNAKNSGNQGTNTPWQRAMINLLNQLVNNPSGNDLHAVTTEITTSSFTELFPAVAGKQNIITDMLVTNGHASNNTWVEFRETSSTGRLIWKGFAKAQGGFIQPSMRHGITAAVGKSIGVVCTTSSAEVVVSATGHKK